MIKRFLNWWQDAPFYQSMWFLPFVLFLWVLAIVKNNFFTKQGDKK
jgi:hypothetical protein